MIGSQLTKEGRPCQNKQCSNSVLIHYKAIQGKFELTNNIMVCVWVSGLLVTVFWLLGSVCERQCMICKTKTQT